RTNYFETVPSDKLALAIKLEADRMRNSFIADADRQAEMTVVRNELERGQNEPVLVLDEAVYATAFREHPYHHPTIGWRADVENVPTARLKEFYDTFYHPSNATAIVVGDFDQGSALAHGLTSRLYQALVERQLAVSVTSNCDQFRDPALFNVYATVRPGVEPRAVEEVILAELGRIADAGLPEAEGEKAKQQILAQV